MATKTRFEVGNQVRVSNGPGATLYKIVTIAPNGFDCTIRQEGLVNGRPYAAQRFDLSLLRHAVTDEMLQAFSRFGLQAVRKTAPPRRYRRPK